MISPDLIFVLANMNFLSKDSISYSFDERANGYARGEGYGVVILKLLDDAIRDNDTIRAVIRATGSNQDGHTPSFTQPSKDAQEALILDTYKKAGLERNDTRYVEAHGTGTKVGKLTFSFASFHETFFSTETEVHFWYGITWYRLRSSRPDTYQGTRLTTAY